MNCTIHQLGWLDDSDKFYSWSYISAPHLWEVNQSTSQGHLTVDQRLQTFQSWPAENKGPRPLELAVSGFFYTGEEDHVQCFSCKLKLHNWEEGEIAWVEHSKWKPYCSYLYLIKDHQSIYHTHRQFCKKREGKDLTELELKAQRYLALEGPPQYNINNEDPTYPCIICLTQERNIDLKPCNHVIICSYCAPSLKKCPLCQAPIAALLRAKLV